jgi:hypothetical protein
LDILCHNTGQHITSDKKYWYYDDINARLLAYDIFKEAKDSNRVAEIENYFYKNRSQYGWINTIHAAQILKRLLSNTPNLKSDAKIIVNGK